MFVKGLFVLFTVVFYCGNGLDLPSNFKKCKRNDKEFSNCLKEAIQDALPKLKNGLPEFNFPSVSPLLIPKMTIGKGSGPVNVVQNFMNVKLHHLPDAKLTKLVANVSNTSASIYIEANFAEIGIEADYDFDGRILFLPLVGNGKSFIKFKKLKATLSINGNEQVKKGVAYFDVDEMKLTLVPEKIEFKFENLFNGDQKLGNEMNKVLNENWKEIWLDVSSGYEEALCVIAQDLSKKIFKKVPHSMLFPLE